MAQQPVFLHRGMRTGGTALVHALEQLDSLSVVYGIMHPMLSWELDDLLHFHSDAWNSKHPEEYYYWRNAEALLRGGMHERFRGRFTGIYCLPAAAEDPEMRDYLSWIIAALQRTDGTPVLCLERHEGVLPWFRANFPDAVHVGLVRDEEAMFCSWLEQALFGSWGFFEAAALAVNAEPGFFGQEPGAWSGDVRALSAADLRRLFVAYNARTDEVRRHDVDLAVTVAELATGGSPTRQRQFAAALGLNDADRETLAQTLSASQPASPPGQRLSAMVDAGLPQRQALLQQADAPATEELRAELAAAKHELALVYRSTSWRVTMPSRRLKDTLRRR